MNEVFLDKLENRENQECENKNADKIISPTLALREKKINVHWKIDANWIKEKNNLRTISRTIIFYARRK